MAKKVRVNTVEDFEKLMQNQDIEISREIVRVALKNLFSKKRFIHVLEVYVDDDESIYDISLDTTDILGTLQQNLKIHERNEDYEGCAKIKQAIEKLTNNE